MDCCTVQHNFIVCQKSSFGPILPVASMGAPMPNHSRFAAIAKSDWTRYERAGLYAVVAVLLLALAMVVF